MIQIGLFVLFFLAGIAILVKGKIAFSKKKLLVKPQSIFVGVALIVAGLINFIPSTIADGMSWSLVLFLLTMIIAPFLSKKVDTDESAIDLAGDEGKKTVPAWLVILIMFGVFFGMIFGFLAFFG